MRKKWVVCLLLGFCLVLWTGYASAQQTLATSQELEQRVRQLEERLKVVEEEKPGKPGTFRAYWKDGLRLDTADKAFKLKIGGRAQLDWAVFDEDNDIQNVIGPVQNGVEFRRARLYMSGLLYDRYEFKVQYDFAGGDVDFKDVYMGVRDIPVVGNFRVGHFKEPFSLEELTSSKYITFMERGLPNAFAIGRNTGLGIFNTAFDKRMTWAVGAFIDADDFGNSIGGGEYNVALRVTGLPWYEEKGRRLVHLGTSYSYGNTPDDAVRFRERPEAHLAPRYVDTGTFDAKNRNFVGFEAALVYDSLSVQGEVTGAFVDRKASGVDDPNFGGAYIYASYFLTGEHRPYKTSGGTFTNLKPENNFLNGEGGLGAWEVAARYSHIDLDDEGIRGGTLNDFTLGLNWYLNPNYRVSFNYIRAHLNGVGDTNIFEMRYQVAF